MDFENQMGEIMTVETFIRQGEDEFSEPLRYEACGLDDVYLCNGFKWEQRGGQKFLRIADRDNLHRAIAQHLVETRKVFTGKEIRFIRVQMGLTQLALGEQLGTTSQSVARWEKNQCEIPGAADRLLRIVFMVSLLNPKKFLEMVAGLAGRIEEMDEGRARPAVFNHGDHKWSEELMEAA